MASRGPLGGLFLASWGSLGGVLGALGGLWWASWGHLGGLCHFMLCWAVLSRLKSLRITGSKPVILVLFLDPEANFRCKNTMILLNLGSLGLAGVRVNKMSESLERNQRFCCEQRGGKRAKKRHAHCKGKRQKQQPCCQVARISELSLRFSYI